MARETELQMVERHVREGAWRLDRQARLVEQKRRWGLPIGASLQLLRTFETTQALHRAHLTRLRDRRG